MWLLLGAAELCAQSPRFARVATRPFRDSHYQITFRFWVADHYPAIPLRCRLRHCPGWENTRNCELSVCLDQVGGKISTHSTPRKLHAWSKEDGLCSASQLLPPQVQNLHKRDL